MPRRRCGVEPDAVRHHVGPHAEEAGGHRPRVQRAESRSSCGASSTPGICRASGGCTTRPGSGPPTPGSDRRSSSRGSSGSPCTRGSLTASTASSISTRGIARARRASGTCSRRAGLESWICGSMNVAAGARVPGLDAARPLDHARAPETGRAPPLLRLRAPARARVHQRAGPGDERRPAALRGLHGAARPLGGDGLGHRPAARGGADRRAHSLAPRGAPGPAAVRPLPLALASTPGPRSPPSSSTAPRTSSTSTGATSSPTSSAVRPAEDGAARARRRGALRVPADGSAGRRDAGDGRPGHHGRAVHRPLAAAVPQLRGERREGHLPAAGLRAAPRPSPASPRATGWHR